MLSPTFAFVIIAVGLLLMVAEMVLATGGFLFIVSAGAVISGVALNLMYDPYMGLMTFGGVVLLVPLTALLASRWMPSSAHVADFDNAVDSTVAGMPGVMGLDQYKNCVGKAVSALRPAGAVDFDGRRIDCVSEGMMIEPDRWVRCVGVKSGRVIVREIEPPTATTFENADFD